jgi:hypothetical protein
VTAGRYTVPFLTLFARCVASRPQCCVTITVCYVRHSVAGWQRSRFVLRTGFVLVLFTFCPGVGWRARRQESQFRVPYHLTVDTTLTADLIFDLRRSFAFGEARPSLKKYEKNIPRGRLALLASLQIHLSPHGAMTF